MSTSYNCRILISKDAKNPQSLELQSELLKIIPNSTSEDIDCQYVVKIIEQKERPFSIQIKKDSDLVDLHIIQYKSMKQLRNKADPYSHLYPELVFDGFFSKVGNFLFQFIVGIFPINIENMGNRVASFCAKNDMILFRFHRYSFVDSKKINFQDIGPHLTLQLRKIAQEGKITFFKYNRYNYEEEKNYVL